jgi:hypothetical protein
MSKKNLCSSRACFYTDISVQHIRPKQINKEITQDLTRKSAFRKMFRTGRVWALPVTLFKVNGGEKMLVYVRVSVWFSLCGHLTL